MSYTLRVVRFVCRAINDILCPKSCDTTKVNLLGGDEALKSGIAIYRLHIPEINQNRGDENCVTIICGRDDQLAGPVYQSLLDNKDRKAVRELPSEESRQRAIAGRVLRRIALSIASSGKQSASDWEFSETHQGRPYVPGGDFNLDFNVTHCDGATMVAVSQNHQVGVDAELICSEVGEALINEVLSKTESKQLKSRKTGERHQKFFELWTLKEAYSKLVGAGLEADFRNLVFRIRPPRFLNKPRGVKVRFLTWKTLNKSKPCQVALAVR